MEFSQSAVPLKKVKKMSAEKISNTDFSKKRQDTTSTKSLMKSVSFEAKQPDIELAHGLKLQDFSLINEIFLNLQFLGVQKSKIKASGISV